MTFLAQLALADLDPCVWTGPTSGHLYVFCDIEPQSISIEGPNACAILHSPAGTELSGRRFPPDLHPSIRIRQRMVTPRIGRGLGKLKHRLRAEQDWQHPVGQLLGWPTWQNDDNMNYLASLRGRQALAWTSLLQTDALGAEPTWSSHR
jgi:hypothetical protein